VNKKEVKRACRELENGLPSWNKSYSGDYYTYVTSAIESDYITTAGHRSYSCCEVSVYRDGRVCFHSDSL